MAPGAPAARVPASHPMPSLPVGGDGAGLFRFWRLPRASEPTSDPGGPRGLGARLGIGARRAGGAKRPSDAAVLADSDRGGLSTQAANLTSSQARALADRARARTQGPIKVRWQLAASSCGQGAPIMISNGSPGPTSHGCLGPIRPGLCF